MFFFPCFLLVAISDKNGPMCILLESAGVAELHIAPWLGACEDGITRVGWMEVAT